MRDRPSEFFDAAYELFLTRSRVRSERAQDFFIADRIVRIESAGSQLHQSLTSALAHLDKQDDSVPNLLIAAWDRPHADMISPLWNESDYGPRGEISGFNNARFRTAFDHGTAALSMLDLETRRAIFWTRDAAQLPSYESAAPLRGIFSWWLQANDFLLVHAAAIARDDRGILLAGAGGSGKSTAALMCLNAGWNHLADDYCALRVGDRSRVFSLYNSIKIDNQWLQSLPAFSELTKSPAVMHENKQIIFAQKYWPERIQRAADCNLILLPRVTDETRTATSEATQAEALRALAPSSMFQTAAEGASMFQRLSEFVRRVPARWLNLGRDVEKIPDVIASCAEKLN